MNLKSVLIPGPQIFAVYEHVIGDINCWCDPLIYQACPVCDGRKDNPSCQQCHGDGIVPEYHPDLPYIILHNPQRFEQRLV